MEDFELFTDEGEEERERVGEGERLGERERMRERGEEERGEEEGELFTRREPGEEELGEEDRGVGDEECEEERGGLFPVPAPLPLNASISLLPVDSEVLADFGLSSSSTRSFPPFPASLAIQKDRF